MVFSFYSLVGLFPINAETSEPIDWATIVCVILSGFKNVAEKYCLLKKKENIIILKLFLQGIKNGG